MSTSGIGKYQFSIPALISAGLIKSSVTKQSQLDISNNWIPAKCSSLSEFLSNNLLQEQVMIEQTQKNYNLLCANGIINQKNIDLPEEVSAWLAVAHTLGVTGAYDYASSGTNSIIAAKLFQQGKFAASFASQVSSILAG
jgi:hypothetical protein